MYVHFTISRSNLSTKVIGSMSRSYEKNVNFTYFNILILCKCLQVINKVSVTYQGQGHIKVKEKTCFQFCHLWFPCIYLIDLNGIIK